MKICSLSLAVFFNLNAIAFCDTCVVRPDHSKYVSLQAMGKLFLNPYSDFVTSGIFIEYQKPKGIRLGVDIITAPSLSNIRDNTPFKIAVLPSIGIKCWEGRRLKIYQKSAIGVSNGDISISNSREYVSTSRNITRGIAYTEVVLACRLGSNNRFRSPTISYSAGFAGDLGVIPFLSEINNYGLANSTTSFYGGFHTGISVGFNPHYSSG